MPKPSTPPSPKRSRKEELNESTPGIKKICSFQEIILSKNDHKGGWKKLSLKWLLRRLKTEVMELERAINKITKDTAPDIDSECADVANFAMMISDNFNDTHRGIS